jgi:hypothetical protein
VYVHPAGAGIVSCSYFLTVCYLVGLSFVSFPFSFCVTPSRYLIYLVPSAHKFLSWNELVLQSSYNALSTCTNTGIRTRIIVLFVDVDEKKKKKNYPLRHEWSSTAAGGQGMPAFLWSCGLSRVWTLLCDGRHYSCGWPYYFFPMPVSARTATIKFTMRSIT